MSLLFLFPIFTPPDVGQSASFTVTFTGQGDDPYGNDGLAVNASQGLGALTVEVLATQELATFSGQSASRKA